MIFTIGLLATWRRASTTAAPEPRGRTRWALLGIPGLWDVRSGSAARGLLSLSLLVFLLLSWPRIPFAGSSGALGFFSGDFFWWRPRNMPPEGLPALVRAFGYPYAGAFWAFLAAGLVALPLIHFIALRDRRRRMRGSA
jgi:hypothetical protein